MAERDAEHKTLDAGRLRHRVKLQKQTLGAQNARGEQAETWPTQATVWAGIESLTGRERQQAQQTQASLDVRIVLRYFPGVDPTWRVQWTEKGGTVHTYYLEAVLVADQIRDWMEFSAQERAV